MKATSVSLILAVAMAASAARAEVSATEAWVRGTVPSQKAAGVFMKIKSREEAKLVGVASPAAKIVELHEMTMKGGVMEMRAVEALPLPAGKTVELEPGGYHVMLFDLAKPLSKGDEVPVTLTLQARDGRKSTTEVTAEVRAPDGSR
ncbi:MAG: copper chaperone PCu(A)C [Betaproteobacteria bacterium]|nr:copper chaperone PCu(A)C [Betaproteobacteria bacterium]